AGILHPDEGAVTSDTTETPDLHVLGHGSAVKARLTVRENLDFWRILYGPTGMDTAAALDRVGLAHAAGFDAEILSAGQTRRLALARLLVSRRAVWLLDEPTAALDSEGSRLVGEMIDAHAQSGGAVIVATHERLALTVPHRSLRLGSPAP
ncbi:MAG: heme ABC exporter ATP-binding protein CcmA, partial [Devosia sp.]